MGEIIQHIWKATTREDRFGKFNWIALLMFGVSLVVIVVCEVTGDPYYQRARGWWYLAPAAFLFMSLIGPVLRFAREEQERAVRVVLFWGLVGLLIFVATFIASYSAFAPMTQGGGRAYDRLLNVIPAVIAIWGAGLGWYTQYQLAMKAHRTSHAFNLIMQTRTCAQYVEMMRTFQLVYPPGQSMQASDEEYFNQHAVARLPGLRDTIDDPQKNSDEKALASQNARKIEAAIAARYLLNYYEFMATALQSRDLDEQVIYDTIAPTVISVFKRTKLMRDVLTAGQPLALSSLRPIVERWSNRKRMDAASMESKPRTQLSEPHRVES